MKYLASAEEMQSIDAHSINELGIPGIVLMEKAAMAVERLVLTRFPVGTRVLIVTERGNNGGDGLALGRLLLHDGYDVTLYEIGGVRRETESYRIQKEILQNLGVPIKTTFPEGNYGLIVDAIFGVGLHRDVTGIQAEVIGRLNAAPGVKLAVDVPSGIHSSTGKVMGTAFRADLTATFGLSKVGLVLYPGAAYAGEVVACDIGFPKKAVEAVSPAACTYAREDLKGLPRRVPYSNKGSYGKVLLVCGSKNMSGAAYLAALAAYRSGSGLVRIFTCEENRAILQTQLPGAILTTYADEEEAVRLLPEALNWAGVVGFGSGLGRSERTERLLRLVLQEGKKPLVIDADGLNCLSSLLAKPEGRALYAGYPAPMLLTPHLKEMSGLIGKPVAEIREDLIRTAVDFADGTHILILKDARTVVAGGAEKIYINTSGNHGMAVGGSGDVLTGICCGFLAGGLPAGEAARLAVYCHGLAGDAAAAKRGYYGLTAEDIPEGLAEVLG